MLLLDPMLGKRQLLQPNFHLSETLLHPTATGGSAMQAIEVLISNGVTPDRILFLNLVASPEGLANVYQTYPQVKVVCAWVDDGLDSQSYSESLLAAEKYEPDTRRTDNELLPRQSFLVSETLESKFE